MAWVRLHDGALTHPKIIGMVDVRRPFDLWIWGLSYAQLHLTDGRIPSDAVTRASAKAAQELCRRGLWEATDDGFLVHDHLEWNDSREVVTTRKKNAKKRKEDWWDRQRQNEERTRSDLEDRNAYGTRSERVGNVTHNQTKPNLVQKDPTASALSAPPPPRGNQHGRIFVHPWQLHALIDTLGPHAANFGLDEWVFRLSALADERGLVLEKKDVWGWVQQQLSEEIRRRGLPVAVANGGQSTADMARDVAIALGIDPELAGIPK